MDPDTQPTIRYGWHVYGKPGDGYARNQWRVYRKADGEWRAFWMTPGYNAAGTVPESVHATAEAAMEWCEIEEGQTRVID